MQISSSNRNVKGEDASATLRATVGGEQLSLCLVADGHGGADTGVYLASHVLQLIVDEANGDPSCSSLEAACDRAFRQSHESVLLLQGTSGATLTVCIINELRGQVMCANVGDSTAIIITSPNVNPSSSDTLFESEDDLSRLSFSSDYGSEPSPTGSTTSSACSSPTACRAEIQFSEQATSNSSSLSGSRKSAALPESECYATLSADHRIQNSQAERDRIVGLGGTLARALHPEHGVGGPLRAWPGGLAVARCIGDADAGRIISPVPSVSTHAFAFETCVVVIASDGVWDAISQRRVVECVRKSSSAASAASRIVNAAVQTRGLLDDVTCVVIMPAVVAMGHKAYWDSRYSPLMMLRRGIGRKKSVSRETIHDSFVTLPTNGLQPDGPQPQTREVFKVPL